MYTPGIKSAKNAVPVPLTTVCLATVSPLAFSTRTCTSSTLAPLTLTQSTPSTSSGFSLNFLYVCAAPSVCTAPSVCSGTIS